MSTTAPPSFILRRWPRQSPPAKLTLSTISGLLDAHGSLDLILDDATFLDSGADNSNYLLRFREHPPLLFRVQQTRPCAAPQYPLLFRALEAPHYLPAPFLAPTLNSPDHPPIALRHWVPGQSLDTLIDDGATISPELFFELGQCLALWHSALDFDSPALFDADLQPRRTFDSHGEAFADFIHWSLRRGSAQDLLASPIKTGIRDLLRRFESRLRTLPTHAGLVHGDLKPGNILVNPSNQGSPRHLMGVIDWDYVRAGSIFLDLAVLYRQRDLLTPNAWSSLSEGLEDGGIVLPDDWETLAQLFDLQHLLGMLNAPSLPEIYQRDLIDYIDASVAALSSSRASSRRSNKSR